MNSNNDDNIITQIGLLTLKFSQIEHLTLKYISILISGNATLNNYIIFQNFTLEKKLQTLIDLIRLKHNGKFEKTQLDLIDKIKKIKNIRNLFIHGDWQISNVDLKANISSISVRQYKIKFNKNEKGLAKKTWIPEKYEPYTIKFFIDYCIDIDKLVFELTEIIKENELIFSK